MAEDNTFQAQREIHNVCSAVISSLKQDEGVFPPFFCPCEESKWMIMMERWMPATEEKFEGVKKVME